MFDVQLPIVIAHGALITVAFFMGMLVYLHNSRSDTNKMFTAIAFTVILWSISDFLVFSLVDPYYALIGIKVEMLSASLFTVCVLFFVYVFPKDKIYLSVLPRTFFLIISVLYVVAGYFIWSDVDIVATLAQDAVVPLPYEIVLTEQLKFSIMPIWGFASIVASLTSVVILIVKYKRSLGKDKKRYLSVIIGLVTTFFLLPVLLFLPVVFFGNVELNYYGPLAYIPLFLGAGYGILRHHIFNVKMMLIEILVLLGLLILFINIFV